MENLRFVTYICRDQNEWSAAQRELVLIDSEMGSNIIEKTGITRFGPPIRVFIKTTQMKLLEEFLESCLVAGFMYLFYLCSEGLNLILKV